MDLQEFLKQRWVIIAVLGIVRLMPTKIGYALVDLAAKRIARQKPKVYQKLRRNIAQIPGTATSSDQLDRLTHQAFRNAGRFYYDFYHLVQGPIRRTQKQVQIPGEVYEKIAKVQQSGRGVLLAGMHTGNFDLSMVALASDRLAITALSTSNPNEAYKVQNRLRSKSGLELVPITPASLKNAIKLLRDGGIIATGMDWPNPEEPCHTEVFGKPAHIPLGTARLALLSDAVTFIISFYRKPDGIDGVTISDPIEVIRTGDRQEDIVQNTQAYVKIFEEFIKQLPDQWMMFHKFWVD